MVQENGRDRLAKIRTLLANDRTLLAYFRTSLSLFIFGLFLIKFFTDFPYVEFVFFAILVGSFALLVIGLVEFFTFRKKTRAMHPD